MAAARQLKTTHMVLAAAIATLSLTATPAHAADIGIYGKTGVTLGQSASTDSLVASNADINLSTFANIAGLLGNANVIGNGFTSTGDVLLNGNMTTGSASTISGVISAGGNVNLSFAQTKTASITAGGNISQGQSATTTGTIRAGGFFQNNTFSVVNGNIFANSTVNIGGTVNGNITHGGALTIDPSGSVTGSTPVGTTPVNPSVVTTFVSPAAIPFTSGGAAVTNGGSAASPLAPGSYGAVSIPTFGGLFLSPGDYAFDSLTMASATSINFVNITPGSHVNIFVTGDVFEDSFTDTTVNGLAFGAADKTLAAGVLLETLGNYSQSSSSGVNFFGTVFAPNGNIMTGSFAKVTGSLIAGGSVNLSGGFTQTTVNSNLVAVPEPAALSLLAGGIIAASLRRRSRSS